MKLAARRRFDEPETPEETLARMNAASEARAAHPSGPTTARETRSRAGFSGIPQPRWRVVCLGVWLVIAATLIIGGAVDHATDDSDASVVALGAAVIAWILLWWVGTSRTKGIPPDERTVLQRAFLWIWTRLPDASV
jgi:hypothetical protein